LGLIVEYTSADGCLMLAALGITGFACQLPPTAKQARQCLDAGFEIPRRQDDTLYWFIHQQHHLASEDYMIKETCVPGKVMCMRIW
jgi:hypothetical protein